MHANKLLKTIMSVYNSKYFDTVFLICVSILTLIYSFTLAYKRFDNFEYGKFDLGNMVQMVYNTSNGRFMELTDQFGTNMPRWGMSHVDPVLIVFVPVSFIVDHPMMLVFFQHVLIISAIFPLYLLFNMKLKDRLAALLSIFIYILYPANGYTLVWTTYHGISFVAPILIWVIWYLEKTNYLERISYKKYFAFWIAIFLMIFGKEEIGAMIGLFGIYVIFKSLKRKSIKLANLNFGAKTGLAMLVIGFIWTFFCFFVLIPAYSELREQSVLNFVGKLDAKSANPQNAIQENFFLMRYSYLGNSYLEVLVNLVLKPQIWIKEVFTKEKLIAIISLVGPLGYFAILSPFWLISLPDIIIVLFSKEDIFNVNNHRIAFITVSLFISYLKVLSYVVNKFKSNHFMVSRVMVAATLLLTVYYSYRTSNPFVIAVDSLVREKVISKVMASQKSQDATYKIGDSRKSKVPRNRKECFDYMYRFIRDKNPTIYTGPDYLGAHAANRYVNALFPGRYNDADMIISDVYDIKALDPLQTDSWQINKDALKRMYSLNRYKHLFSCAQMNAFVVGNTSDSIVLDSSTNFEYDISLKSEKTELKIKKISLPKTVSISNQDNHVKLTAGIISGTFKDQVNFYKFESSSSPSNYFYFIDYLTTASEHGFDTEIYNQYMQISYDLTFITGFSKGEYNVFYGVGDLLQAREVFIGKITVK